MDALKTLDLFCGAGGITEGFRQAGFECVFANDFNAHAIASFRANHPRAEADGRPIEALNPEVIRQGLGIVPGELDCLVGGPPCQGFSINAPVRDAGDERNGLFLHFLNFVDTFRPKTVLFENVPGILSLDGGMAVRVLHQRLAAMGYEVSQRILFAAHYGVPQERWRFILLASQLGPAPSHPAPTHNAVGRANFRGGRTLTFRLSECSETSLAPHVSVSDALADLPALAAGGGQDCMAYDKPPHSPYAAAMREGSPAVTYHVAPRISGINLERLSHIKPGGNWLSIPFDLLPSGMQRARRSDHTRRYGRLAPEGLSGTVMTKMDPHWGPAFHYDQHRTLTVREAARLQSFPDRYVFSGPRVAQYEQIGNAVPVGMARALALTVRRHILAGGAAEPSEAAIWPAQS